MEKRILDKATIERLMKMEGEARGISFKDDAAYVVAKRGKEDLKKVEEELARIGCPIRYDEIRALGYYPIGWRVLSLLVMKKIFGWGNRELRELGGFAPGNSLIVRVYTRFFHSVEKVVEVAPRMFGEYYNRGEIAVPDYDLEKKYAILETRDLDLHPDICRVMEGYFATFVRMVVEAKEVKCRETKCTFEGQDRHQFKITWK